MKKTKINSNFILSAFFFIFFLVLILALFFDKDSIGDGETVVGLSTINGLFKEKMGYNSMFYLLSNIIGVFSIMIMLLFLVIGIVQLIKRKSIKAVDKEIIYLGLIYIVFIFIYFFFEFVVVNYRPIMIDGEIEPSFPSSHTMLVIIAVLTALFTLDKYIPSKKTNLVVDCIGYLIIVAMIIFRFLSAVHWFTDILGGIFIALSLSFLYKGLINNNNNGMAN